MQSGICTLQCLTAADVPSLGPIKHECVTSGRSQSGEGMNTL